MVSKPDMNPDNTPIKRSSHSTPSEKSPPPAWEPKPLNWLGMSFNSEQTKQIWTVISQTIGRAIQHEKDRAVAALKKLRKSTEEDGDDS